MSQPNEKDTLGTQPRQEDVTFDRCPAEGSGLVIPQIYAVAVDCMSRENCDLDLANLRSNEALTASDNLHTDDESELRGDKESYLCAVCLDVYFNPYMCYPCHHIFCEPCLRMLAKDNPASTPCPLCRATIARVFFQTELNNSTKSFFPTEYLKLKENFQKSNSAKWPLPSCKKAFRVFEGISKYLSMRHFPHAAHRMDYMDFEDDSRGWRFDMDMVIIYIYSVNWVIGFIVFCFLCYFFFPF
nr:PREDICTED: E3 ubiquitin-protein ligase RNF180-like [Haliaeetus albicilla]